MQFDDIDPSALRRREGKKWRAYDAGVLPAWVADMDFLPAAPIREALTAAVAAGDLGYGPMPDKDPLREVFVSRCRARYCWEVRADRTEIISDVVQGLYMALQACTRPGDGALVMTPIYPPFLHAVKETGRRPVLHPLTRGAQGYELDIEALEAAIDPATRLLMLCSPHNPSGRAWRRDELEGIAELVLRHDLQVVSDEIHADLVLDDRPHIAFASLSAEIEARTVTLMSASKAFNIAGMRCAVMVPGSADLQARLRQMPRHLRGAVSTLGSLATRIAWQECDEWHAAALDYLRGNRDMLATFLREKLPDIVCTPPEATYLAWLDCTRLGLPDAPARYLLDHARVALSEGSDFGAPGAGHVRINFATSRANLGEILSRMERCLAQRNALAERA